MFLLFLFLFCAFHAIDGGYDKSPNGYFIPNQYVKKYLSSFQGGDTFHFNEDFTIGGFLFHDSVLKNFLNLRLLMRPTVLPSIDRIKIFTQLSIGNLTMISMVKGPQSFLSTGEDMMESIKINVRYAKMDLIMTAKINEFSECQNDTDLKIFKMADITILRNYEEWPTTIRPTYIEEDLVMSIYDQIEPILKAALESKFNLCSFLDSISYYL